jgi:signal transduction histidine kinase
LLPLLLDDPAILEGALDFLGKPAAGFVDWDRPEVLPVYRACLEFARHAEQLAGHSGLCDPEEAWIGGLLAPLGWLAVCAADPAAAAACLADPGFAEDPARCQQRLWNLDQSAIARRLARAWQLPAWLAAVVGHLGLPGETLSGFGADLELLQVVQAAVGGVKGRGSDLGLSVVSGQSQRDPRDSVKDNGPRTTDNGWQDPYSLPWLRDLLAVAAENRRLRGEPIRERLERDLDALQEALEEQVRDAAERVRTGKLLALAEFAAGAGHEINNPLAVISGQAQYLLSHERDWFPGAPDDQPRRVLEKIIGQTRRIHGILRDLMQYARPPAPRRARVDLPALLGEVAASLSDLAEPRRVRVEVHAPGKPLAAHVDVEQVRTALSCLLRNAIEAAPADGWSRLVLRDPGDDPVLEVAVEDNGPGPEPALREALFDPFFSGRSAGRGRGLGLPIAWRLLRTNGGDVCLETTRTEELTRFRLTLPRSFEPAVPVDPVASPRALAAVNGRHSA